MDKVQTINAYFTIKKINAEVSETIKSDDFITFIIQLHDITQYKKFNKTMEKELFYLLGVPVSLIINDTIRIVINTKQTGHRSGGGVTIPLGTDTNGQTITLDFSKNPHWLVGGATGSGKSVFLNNVINELLKNYNNIIEFLFIDLKQVEFFKYNLLYQNITNVANNLPESLNVLDNAIMIMNNRYNKYKHEKVLNIKDYNERQTDDNKKDRYLFVIIDELAELMLSDKNNVQDKLQRLLQLGRAAGVYVISATQRPDSNILAGTLKVNYTTRICFKVSSVYDSKTVLTRTGAELLSGDGDGYLLENGSCDLVRFQGFAPVQNDDVLLQNYIDVGD